MCPGIQPLSWYPQGVPTLRLPRGYLTLAILPLSAYFSAYFPSKGSLEYFPRKAPIMSITDLTIEKIKKIDLESVGK
jgi:hypothetical protein